MYLACRDMRRKVGEPPPADRFVSLPRGIVTVDVERVHNALLQLSINTGTTTTDPNVAGIDSPWSTT